METIIRNATSTSPYLEMNSMNGEIIIKGRAIDYNPNDFWSTINNLTIEYFENPKQLTTINLNFEYINTQSTKKLFFLLKLIESNNSNNTNIKINWICKQDDVDMIDMGEDINALLLNDMIILNS